MKKIKTCALVKSTREKVKTKAEKGFLFLTRSSLDSAHPDGSGGFSGDARRKRNSSETGLESASVLSKAVIANDFDTIFPNRYNVPERANQFQDKEAFTRTSSVAMLATALHNLLDTTHWSRTELKRTTKEDQGVLFFFILATGDLSELISLESSSAATRKDYVTGNPASTGIAFAIARRLTYPKLAVRLTRLI